MELKWAFLIAVIVFFAPFYVYLLTKCATMGVIMAFKHHLKEVLQNDDKKK